jgi:hypothetical protein
MNWINQGKEKPLVSIIGIFPIQVTMSQFLELEINEKKCYSHHGNDHN